MIVEPKVRGFICTTAHPDGCAKNVRNQIAVAKAGKPFSGCKTALVVGASTGYGLASRIALAFGGGAKTLGVSFDRPPKPGKTATAGWYNTAAFERFAAEDGLWAGSLNGDAFSADMKKTVCEKIRRELGQVDALVYSIASPVRVDPRGVKHRSVIKPVGAPFTNKTIDVNTGAVTEITVPPATGEEVADTVAVMGGEDWELWVDALLSEGLFAKGAVTLAYSYIGPTITHPVYRDGTIGMAKKDLERAAGAIGRKLEAVGGSAAVSVNKAVVTQASSAIPVVPLYISILFRIMKEKGLHEDCIEQMRRLYAEKVFAGGLRREADGLVHMDDLEMRADVQEAVMRAWENISTETVGRVADLDGYRSDFLRLFGFGVPGVDYQKEANEETAIPSIGL